MTSKVSSRSATEGPHGAIALAAGERVSMRMWRNEPATDDKPSAARPYETVGYVVAGRAELVLAGETVSLSPAIPGS